MDLVIHNGLEGYSGGQEISEEDEETLGALTVANLNDTDGDGTVDKDDNDVSVTGQNPPGRNEIDLMKLVVKKPDPDDGGNATLTVKSGDVKLWKHSTKQDEFVLTGGSAEIATEDLPMTLWIEARSPSQAMRDIEIELAYNGTTDTVKATAVWAEMTGFRNTQVTKTLTANAAANQSKILVNDTTGLEAGSHIIIREETTFNRDAHAIAGIVGTELTLDGDLSITYLSGDKVREGASRYASSDLNTHILNSGGELGAAYTSPITSNGMEMEFTLLPSEIGSESRLVWDITRQVESKAWKVDSGTTTPIGTAKDWPANVEEPNDDNDASDEDNEPEEDKIYATDFVGFATDFAFADRAIVRANFWEFVRVRIGGAFTNQNGVVEGSRCSDRVAWRSRLDVTVNTTTGKWQRNGADNKIVLGHEAIGDPP